MALVSCIIPSAGRPTHLGAALDSVLAQTHPEMELIVVSESGDHQTAQVVTEYETTHDVVRGIESEAGAPMPARNRGIDAATGEYVAFLDDDDRWHPERIATQLPLADTYSFVSCLPRIVRPEQKRLQPHDFEDQVVLEWGDVFDSVRYFPPSDSIGLNYLIPSCLLAKTEDVRSIGGFRPTHHEWDFYLRLVEAHGPGVVLERALVDFDRTDIDRYSDDEDVVRRLMRTFSDHRNRAAPSVRRRVLSHLYFAAYRHRERAVDRIAALLRSLYYDPTNVQFIEPPWG